MNPMSKLNVVFLILFGVVLGLGCYSFIYAKGYSYMSDDPKACVNCHIMNENMDSWIKGTHHHVAKCNDCHLPHNIVGKYAVKALNGFNHSAAFTLQNFPDPIRIREHSLKVVKSSCLSCHQPMVQAMNHGGKNINEETNCLHCHRNVGHVK
ncbi:cytochrome c nitrite reductase small subunit [Bdellovibrio bacteriovorus]|uniref:Cytochrome c nitrite reductase small subunit n=2 Tax=Pseudobdellovibrionaceae TaxID=213483 RepID=A0A162FTZ2_BDEBC|nr:cytochrome c nitrite reductase small subunit [Bdellovibrio bacteriovorus]